MSWIIHSEYPAGAAFGACFKCRSDRRAGERILDPNLVSDDLPPWIVPGGKDGHIMFCESCITEAAQELGMLTPAQVAKDIEAHATAVADAEYWKTHAKKVEDALDALRWFDAPKASK